MNTTLKYSGRNKASAEGFTLAEVLAAMLFMAIVIPIAIQGLRIASLAGEVSERKSQATRIAERILNESIATTNWMGSGQSGKIVEGTREFTWTLLNEVWSQPLTNNPQRTATGLANLGNIQPTVDQTTASRVPMNLVSVEVRYQVQGRGYTARLSTLMGYQ